MKTDMMIDTLFVCLGLTIMLKIGLALASYNATVQLISVLPREFLYVTAFPFVF